MPRTEDNLRNSEEFIRSVLQKNFGQAVDAEKLRLAAQRLCEAIPAAQQEVA